jgi:hypothetical protein
MSVESIDKYCCRVCGLRLQEPPWDGNGNPNWGWICPCCDTEIGLGDRHELNVKDCRAKWLKDGGKWAMPAMRPEEWDLAAQLKQVPRRFRYPDERIWQELGVEVG